MSIGRLLETLCRKPEERSESRHIAQAIPMDCNGSKANGDGIELRVYEHEEDVGAATDPEG
jgi:hypothetical protein